MGAEVFHALKGLLHERGLATAVGDEGGFAPDLGSDRGRHPAHPRGGRARGLHARASRSRIALDPATTELYDASGRYHLAGEGRVLDSAELVGFWDDLCARYPIVSIEDGMAEDDWDGWRRPDRAHRRSRAARRRRPLRHQRRAPAARASSAASRNAILVKVNQIGTLSETLDTIALARAAGYASIMSHRSGETEDTTIADLAVAARTGQIKTGAPSRSDRVAKYNRLLRIEEALGDVGHLSRRAALRAFAAQPR